MSRIAIVNVSLSPRDAVGIDALHMREVLRRQGHEVELFCSRWVQRDEVGRDVAEAADFLAGDPAAMLLYHHAVGWEAGVELVRRVRCRRVVRYHNVTPARFFAGYGGEAARACQAGREQTRQFVRLRCDLYLADSPFNQAELLEAGAEAARCAVVPPFHQIDRLAAVRPDPRVLRDCQGQTNLLFVGRRVPNKGHRFLIDAFAIYHEHFDRDSRLLLVGREAPPLPAYTNLLREQADRLGVLDRVVFLNGATEAELRAYYQTASAFVVASEHEGFCVPVVEALALGVPVVAYGTTAVPHTLGSAGLNWDEPDPFLLAQSVDAVVRDGSLRQRLADAGRRRYHDHFANGQVERAFLDALTPLCAAA